MINGFQNKSERILYHLYDVHTAETITLLLYQKKLKYGIVYFLARHIYESSLLYKLGDWYFKAPCQTEYWALPAASATSANTGSISGRESKTERVIVFAKLSAY